MKSRFDGSLLRQGRHKCPLRRPSASTTSFLFSFSSPALGRVPFLRLYLKPAGVCLGCPSHGQHDNCFLQASIGQEMGGLVWLRTDWHRHCSIRCVLEADFSHHDPGSTSRVWDWVHFFINTPRVTILPGVIGK